MSLDLAHPDAKMHTQCLISNPWERIVNWRGLCTFFRKFLQEVLWLRSLRENCYNSFGHKIFKNIEVMPSCQFWNSFSVLRKRVILQFDIKLKGFGHLDLSPSISSRTLKILENRLLRSLQHVHKNSVMKEICKIFLQLKR